MAMIGQAVGPSGPAALAVEAPIWNIIYSLGLLMGIGGSVLFSARRGQHPGQPEKSNEFFTVSLAGALILALICWAGLLFADRYLLEAFGADESMVILAKQYLYPIKFTVPCFLLNQFLAAYLRNDGSASLAAGSVLGGGIVNIVGDWFFIFPCQMRMTGAGLATAAGAVITLILLSTHFLMRKNTHRLVRTRHFFRKLQSIVVSGFSTVFSDIAMGLLTILFNRQILMYLGADALSVYAIIINLSIIVQCFGYSIGQASQPIISAAWGAGRWKRVIDCLRYALISCAIFGILWTLASSFTQEFFVFLFMKPTETILQIALGIIGVYGLSFLLLPFNIFASYYLQGIMKPGLAFLLSALRGAVVSGDLILSLPVWMGPDALWQTMPSTELPVSLLGECLIVICTRRLSNPGQKN